MRHVLLGTLVLVSLSDQAAELEVDSPDGRTRARVDLKEGRLTYSASRDGQPLIMPSSLRLQLTAASPLRNGLRIADSKTRNADATWTQPWGEVATVREQYNELRVTAAEIAGQKRSFVFV